MATITIRDVSTENLDDLNLCVPLGRRAQPAFVTGMAEKQRWAAEMLNRWGGCAKLAYADATPIGLIQYVPIPAYRALFVPCIFVPEQAHWRQGVATRLLRSLIEHAQEPQAWFEGRPALLLITKPFPGELPGQLPARTFFLREGFRDAGGDILYYPLTAELPPDRAPGLAAEAAAAFLKGESAEYIRQEDDKGKAVIVYGPSFCPWSYTFWQLAAKHIEEAAPGLRIRWINVSAEPQEAQRRGGFTGCVVNAVPIKSFALDKEGFQREVREALATSPAS